MEKMRMTKKEQMAVLVDIYTDLQRIQKAEDRDKEISIQLCKAKAKLVALGVMVEDLTVG